MHVFSAIGVAVGVAGGIALVGLLVICFIRKRRKNTAQSKTRDLQTLPPASIGTSTTTTTTTTTASSLSQTIPSFPFRAKSTYFGAHVFEYAELEEATENFHPSKQLGDGGFGTVYYGMFASKKNELQC